MIQSERENDITLVHSQHSEFNYNASDKAGFVIVLGIVGTNFE